jgi:hypothetical protein
MSLTSTAFLYLFLPLCAAVYYVIPCRKTQTPRNLFLLGASFVFYAWGQAIALVLILGLTAAVWLLGLLVSGRKKTKLGKALVFFTVLINVGALFVYKYLDFTLDNKQPITRDSADIEISRYQTKSKYLVRPGESIMLSGYKYNYESEDKKGTPWLSKIPWIGERLFGNTNDDLKMNEMLLVVTVDWAIEDANMSAERSLFLDSEFCSCWE